MNSDKEAVRPVQSGTDREVVVPLCLATMGVIYKWRCHAGMVRVRRVPGGEACSNEPLS